MNVQPKTRKQKPLVKASVIARHFSVSTTSVRNWARAGDIPFVRIGSSLRFDLDAVKAATERQPATSTR